MKQPLLIRRVIERLPRPTDAMRVAAHFFMSLAVAALATLALISFVSTTQDAREALRQRQDTANKAFSRVNDLLDQITILQSQITTLQNSAQVNAGRIAELQTQVAALIEQVRQQCAGRANCGPVITARPSGPTSPSTPTTTAPPSPPVTAPPSQPQPSPAPPPSQRCALIICLPGGVFL